MNEYDNCDGPVDKVEFDPNPTEMNYETDDDCNGPEIEQPTFSSDVLKTFGELKRQDAKSREGAVSFPQNESTIHSRKVGLLYQLAESYLVDIPGPYIDQKGEVTGRITFNSKSPDCRNHSGRKLEISLEPYNTAIKEITLRYGNQSGWVLTRADFIPADSNTVALSYRIEDGVDCKEKQFAETIKDNIYNSLVKGCEEQCGDLESAVEAFLGESE